MGTTAYVSYRYKGKIQGFSMSGDGYYECAGMSVLSKFKELSNEELIDFFIRRVTFLDPDSEDPIIQDRIEMSDWACYDIWEKDWKKDSIDIEDGKTMVGEDSVSREYGYLFDLDNDIVEVYNQGELDEVNGIINDVLKLIIRRDNIEAVQELFEHEWEISKRFNDENFERLFLEEKGAY